MASRAPQKLGQAEPERVQRTPVSEVLETEAEKGCVSPRRTVADSGDTVTVMDAGVGGGGVGVGVGVEDEVTLPQPTTKRRVKRV